MFGGRKARCRKLPAAGNIVYDALTINRHGERLPNESIVQWKLRYVHPVEIGAEVRIDAQELRMFAPVAVDAIDRDRIGDMQLPGAKGAFLHIVAIDGMKDNAIEC